MSLSVDTIDYNMRPAAHAVQSACTPAVSSYSEYLQLIQQ